MVREGSRWFGCLSMVGRICVFCEKVSFGKDINSTVAEFWNNFDGIGGAENARVENAARSKLHGWKMQEWNLREDVFERSQELYVFNVELKSDRVCFGVDANDSNDVC